MRGVCVLLLLLLAAAPAISKDPPSDDIVYDRVIRRLANDRDLKTTAIAVTIQQGAVTLRGMVDNEKLRLRAELIVRKVGGVKKVVNELKLRP